MSSCPNHPEVRSSRPCSMCGRGFCERCIVDLAGRAYCERCKESPAFAGAAGATPGASAAGAQPKLVSGGSSYRLPLFIGGGCLLACLVLAGVGFVGARILKTKATGALATTWEVGCRATLFRIWLASERYRSDHGAFPKRGPGESAADVIARLRKEGYLDSPEKGDNDLACPGRVISEGFEVREGDYAQLSRTSYEGFEDASGAAADAPLVWDRDASNHGGRGRNVLFRNGQIRFVPEGEPARPDAVLPPPDVEGVGDPDGGR